MQLSSDRSALAVLDDAMLRKAILERRFIIRHSRDQRLDDRCWMDDYAIWLLVEGLVTAPVIPFEYDAVMQRCHQFYHQRRAERPDPMPSDAITDSAHWDDDVAAMLPGQLLDHLLCIQEAIVTHCKAHHRTDRPGTADDDRVLYLMLPEKLPADFRLPPEEQFLGEAQSPDAGCPAFWRSHDGCDSRTCNPHQWGPCKK